MKPVLIYSHPDEPITQALFSSELDRKFGMIKLSLDSLLKDTVIIDEFDESKVKIDWTLPSGEKVLNSENFFLINRVLSVPENLFHDFSEEDRLYSLTEFRSYLAFALEAFPFYFSKPGAFGLSGNRFSLPRQWEMVRQLNCLIQVPNYFLGNVKFCDLKGDLVYSEPFNYYYWKPGQKIRNTAFVFEKPKGKPCVACLIGDQIEVFFYHSCDQLSEEYSNLVKEKSRIISQLFNYSIAECLFFIDDKDINFGMITNIPYASRHKNWFSYNINSFFTQIIGRNGKS
jgi:hypothetical protein